MCRSWLIASSLNFNLFNIPIQLNCVQLSSLALNNSLNSNLFSRQNFQVLKGIVFHQKSSCVVVSVSIILHEISGVKEKCIGVILNLSELQNGSKWTCSNYTTGRKIILPILQTVSFQGAK